MQITINHNYAAVSFTSLTTLRTRTYRVNARRFAELVRKVEARARLVGSSDHGWVAVYETK